MSTTRIEGLKVYRHKKNQLEQQMHDDFVGMGEERMAQILGESPTKRDMVVMATTIQWLGSPVGQDFLVKHGHGETGNPEAVQQQGFFAKIIGAFKNRIQ